ncbi:AAA family ATPase [Candidatus Micrarchaeota archaeon]|nr:AAA family ATPase [Candidatus Micrarchaeota archaeon]
MKLIIIHGAPGVGKYTVAKELEKSTNFKLLHIHSIYDFLENIFGKEKYEVSLKIMNNMLLDIFEEAAKLKFEGIILTYATLAEDNFSFVKKLLKRLEKYKTDLCFVHLSCNMGELRKRILANSRKKFKKTKNLKELEYLLSIKDYGSTFPNSKTLEVDNTKISPKKVAKKVIEHYLLNK